jgi:hypothetical protein
VTWELPPLPLSPITHPPLLLHLPSQMGHLEENPPPMTTMDMLMDMLMDSLRQTGPLPEIRAADTIPPKDPLFIYPITKAHGKSTVKSLMCPQDVTQRLLPRNLFLQLQQFCYNGCPAHCGPDWTAEVIKAAMAVGPHVGTLIPENAQLIWEDIEYQVKAGFVCMIVASNLIGENQPPNLKISGVAVVPQDNCRGCIILNLSTEVANPKYADNWKAPRSKHSLNPEPEKATKSTHHNQPLQLLVNDMTEPAKDQSGIKALGPALPSILKFMFDTDCTWEIDWQKIDLSDGFWRMIICTGAEHNFAFQMPTRATDTDTFFVVPSSLQMGWKNSPTYFCIAMQTTENLSDACWPSPSTQVSQSPTSMNTIANSPLHHSPNKSGRPPRT